MRIFLLSFIAIFFSHNFLYSQTEPLDTDVPADGYRNVSTLDHLLWISLNLSSWSDNFELDNDIDASATSTWNVGDHDGNPLTPDSAMGFSPIGIMSNQFFGNFEGHGHSINNLYINRPIIDYVAFIGVSQTSNINQLNFSNADITGNYRVAIICGLLVNGDVNECETSGQVTGARYIGGLVAELNTCDVSNCYSDAVISGYAYIGGIVGTVSNGTISGCNTSSTVSGSSSIGGFVGFNYTGIIDNCYATGDVTGIEMTGGFIGYLGYSGSIQNSYCSGTVTGTGSNTGGFVSTINQGAVTNCYTDSEVNGEHLTSGFISNGINATIKYCYSTGDVTGNTNSSGFMANNSNSDISNCYTTSNVTGTGIGAGAGFIYNNYNTTIKNCYSTGDINAANSGGFACYNQGTGVIDDCFSTGEVPTGDLSKGFILSNNATVINCFWDTETSGNSSSAAGTGKTTAEMNDYNTFTDAGWDFSTVWMLISEINNGYPFFWEGFSDNYEPTDTDTDTFINISNLAELRWISENISSWTSDLELDNSINAIQTQFWNLGDHDANVLTPDSAMGFVPIGIATSANRFEGDFNGNENIISNLFINRLNIDYVGLFGYSYQSNIYDLGLVNVDIKGLVQTGALCGYGQSCNINRIYTTGNVSGTNFVGGLAGDLNGNANNCYSHCQVTGNNYVGGLLGLNAATVNNSYSTGQVSGSSNIGGLIGSNSFTVNNCFWDTETSGQPTSDGGTGKTTSEMNNDLTFTDAGWDFMDETANGSNDYWGINTSQNNQYPFLAWQGYFNQIYPNITTVAALILGDEKAQTGGDIILGSISPITSKGIVWNTSGTPDTTDNVILAGSGDADYNIVMDELSVDQSYFVRAFAINGRGIKYANEISFLYTAIPTLPEWGLIILGSMIGIIAVRRIMK